MSLQIESDLRLEFEGHSLHVRDEGDDLVAEFSSLSAARRLRSSLPVAAGPLPEVCRLPGSDEINARIEVRGRVVATLDTRDHVATVRMRWWGAIATLLRLPSRGK